MKYFLIVTLTIAVIQLTKCQDDSSESNYGDDGALFSYDEVEDRIDDSPKPIYDIKDAPKLFKKFVRDFKKKYENDKVKQQHYKNFVENLKEINRINSDKEYSSTADINLFTDYSADERQGLLGVSF